MSLTTIVFLLLIVVVLRVDLCLLFSLFLLSTSASGSSGLISSISELLSITIGPSSSGEKVNGKFFFVNNSQVPVCTIRGNLFLFFK